MEAPMRKENAVFRATLIVVTIITLVVPAQAQPVTRSQTLPAMIGSENNLESVQISTQWTVYEDSEFGFSLEYPASWDMSISLEHGHGSPEYVIRRRIAFEGLNGALVHVDIWANPEKLNLMDWLAQHDEFAVIPSPATISESANATIGGVPAVMTVAEGAVPMMTVVLANTSSVFRIEYVALDNGQAQEIYQHMLFAFRLDDQIQTASNIFSLPTLPQLTELVAPASTTCCGYTDSQENVYPCGPNGNCTWWAAYKRPDIGADNWHGAGNWFDRAQSEGFGVCRTNTPSCYNVKGATAWYSYGHVAHAENSYPEDLSVSEMSYWGDWGRCAVNRGTPGKPDGYIFGRRLIQDYPVVLFEHAGFFGDSTYFPGEGKFNLSTHLKDRASSIYIAEEWSVRLYTEPDQRGVSWVVDEDEYDLQNLSLAKVDQDGNYLGLLHFNDNIASLELFHYCCINSTQDLESKSVKKVSDNSNSIVSTTDDLT